MDNNFPKITPFIILAIAVALLLLNNIMSTSLSISDTDPSTYIIVPMLMLIPFSLFMYKTEIKPEVKHRDITIGIALFILFVLGSLYLRFIIPLAAESFKADMVLFPIAIASFATVLFGLKNAHKFWPMMIYSVFASPAFLLPIFNLNMAFASLNTQIVYSALHALYQNVTYIAPITINFNGTLIGIGEACAGVGAIIAIVMFLYPVACFYKGKSIKKLYWILSGVILLFVLNLIRMFGISVLFIYYGLAQAASSIHLFAGILLFYITLIIIVIIADRYGISFPRQRSSSSNSIPISNVSLLSYFAVIALGMVYVYASAPYTHLQQISPLSLQQNPQISASSQTYDSTVSGILNSSYLSSYTLDAQPISNASVAILATNETFNATSPIIAIFSINIDYLSSIFQNTTIISSNRYVDTDGNGVAVYQIDSDSHGFYVAYSPKLLNSSQGSADVMYTYVIMPENVTPAAIKCSSNLLDSSIYSLFARFNQNETNLLSPFCISDMFIKSAGN